MAGTFGSEGRSFETSLFEFDFNAYRRLFSLITYANSMYSSALVLMMIWNIESTFAVYARKRL